MVSQTPPLLVCTVDNVRKISNLLKSVHIKDKATFIITRSGIKVIVEEYSSLQAIAFLQANIFDKYEVTEAAEFGISLNTLLECLNIFGTSTTINSAPALKLVYNGYGSSLVCLLTDHGVCTDCSIKTMDADIQTEFDFRNSQITNKVLIKGEAMKVSFGELDISSKVLEIEMNNEKIKMSTFGSAGVYAISYSSDCDAIENCESSVSQCCRYNLGFMNAALKTLNLSSKVSFRMNERGFLSMHFLLEMDGLSSFIEYLVCPEEDHENQPDSPYHEDDD